MRFKWVNHQQQKSAPSDSADYCSFLFCFFSSLKIFNFINFIEVLRACRATSIETHVSSPHAASRRSAQRWRISSESDPVCPGPEEPPHGVLSIALSVGIGECPVMSNFGLSPNSFLICSLFSSHFPLCSFYPGRHVPVPYSPGTNLAMFQKF